MSSITHIAVHTATGTTIALAGLVYPAAWLAFLVWAPASALAIWAAAKRERMA